MVYYMVFYRINVTEIDLVTLTSAITEHIGTGKSKECIAVYVDLEKASELTHPLVVLVLVVNRQVGQPLPDCPPRTRQHADVGGGVRAMVLRSADTWRS